MPTPKEGYRLKDGSRVPGTTTVIGRFKESGALMKWACSVGFEQGKRGDKEPDLYKKSSEAADIGTVAHQMVESSIKQEASDADLERYVNETLPEGSRPAAWSAFNAFRTWARNYAVNFTFQEVALVSENYKYGGTIDAIGVINGATARGLALFDWKTSKAIYGDYLVQVAAYKQLWEENNPRDPLTEGMHLLRFAKQHGDFHHHHFPRLDEAWRQFELFREAYALDRKIKDRAK